MISNKSYVDHCTLIMTTVAKNKEVNMINFWKEWGNNICAVSCLFRSITNDNSNNLSTRMELWKMLYWGQRLFCSPDQVLIWVLTRKLPITGVDTEFLQPSIHFPQAMHHTLTSRVTVAFKREKHQATKCPVSFQSSIESLRLHHVQQAQINQRGKNTSANIKCTPPHCKNRLWNVVRVIKLTCIVRVPALLSSSPWINRIGFFTLSANMNGLIST